MSNPDLQMPISADPPAAENRQFGLHRAALVLLVAGGVLSLLTLFVGETPLRRFAFSYLWGFVFFWAIALGALFFVALQHLTGAVWSVVVRRPAEMFAAMLKPCLLLFIPLALLTLFGARSGLFPWAVPELVEGDALLEMKRPYLNVWFFVVRGGVFFGLWLLYARKIIGPSLAAETEGADPTATALAGTRVRGISAHFMPVFALTMSFVAIDWVMSLEPHWFSSIFPAYIWSGMTVSALAAITLAVVWLRRNGFLGAGLVRKDHMYNFGALLFAFTCFWAYLAVSQFMLIWYANIPEETVYFVHRMEHGWLKWTILLALLRFVLPFFLLLPRWAKQNDRALVLASVLILIGQWLDLYWLIYPQFSELGPVFGWQEVGPVLWVTGLLLWCAARFIGRYGMLPEGDPRFAQSVQFHL